MMATEETLADPPSRYIIFLLFSSQKNISKEMNKNKNTNLLLTTIREKKDEIKKILCELN